MYNWYPPPKAKNGIATLQKDYTPTSKAQYHEAAIGRQKYKTTSQLRRRPLSLSTSTEGKQDLSLSL